MKLGLITPCGGVSTGGRPPSLFALNPSARVVAGVDVGATHARAVLADLSGEVLADTEQRLDIAAGPGPVLGWVGEAIDALLAESGRPSTDLAAMGVGLPGPVEHSTGRPKDPPIMPGWDGYDVSGHLRRRHDVPVLIDNDVNMMALGERSRHQSAEDLVFIKVGTGIGAGIISRGDLHRGAQGTAGDLGHVRVVGADDVQCRCGNIGCLEAVAAGPALAAKLRAHGLPAETVQDVVDLVRAGDLNAVRVVRAAGRAIGDVVATLVNILNPSVVVIGGLVADAGEHLLAGIREVVYQRSPPLATEHLRIIGSAGGRTAAATGAVGLAIEHVLSPESIDAATVAVSEA